MAEHKTESERVQDTLRREVLNGTLRQGMRLPQRRLAERYGTTSIVVREALRSLEAEGLVELVPKWGATVTEITEKKLHERYVVREALEGMAARIAATEMGPRDAQMLEHLAMEVDRLHRDPLTSPGEKARVHQRLHDQIVELSGCDELVTLVRRFNLHSIILSNAYHVDWSAETENWHLSLVHAIASGDPDEAEKKMREHVRRGFQMESAAIAGGTKPPATPPSERFVDPH